MKTYPTLFLSLLLHLLPGAAWGADAVKVGKDATAATVGVLGSRSRMVFEGNGTFSAERLYQGLHTHGDWLLAAHPEAPLATYVEVTQAALVRGYQRAGFPMAKVTQSRWLTDPQRLVCVIEEGPRYTAGEVTVTGAKSVPAALIIEKLTTAEEKTDDAGKKSKGSIEWEKGKPAALDATRRLGLREVVLKLLAKEGRVQAKVAVEVVRDDTARTAALQVKILAEGPAAVLDAVTCTGLKRDSEAALLKYLGVAKGQPFLSGRVQEIEALLLRSARYTSYKVTATPRKADRPEMELKLELVEMPEAPKLGVPLNATQGTLLKATAWLNDLVRTGSEDLLLKLSLLPKKGGREELELIYNAQRGLQVTLVLTDDAEGRKNPRRYTLRYAEDEMTALFSTQEGGMKQWLRQPISSHWLLDLYVKIETQEPKDGKTMGSLSFGGTSKQKAGNELLKLVLTMTPAAALLQSLKNAREWQSKDGLLVMKNEAAADEGEYRIVIEEATGRVRGIENGSWNKGRTEFTQFNLTPVKGAWDKATRELEAETAGLVNSYDAKEGLASWAGWLTAGFLHGGAGEGERAQPEEIARRVAAAQELARRLGVSVPEFFSAFNAPEGAAFFVPNAPVTERTQKLSTSLVAQYGLYLVDMLVSEGSWPWLLVREVYYSTNGRNEYTGRILQQVRDDPQLGPVGSYLASVLLDWTLPAAAGGFRQLALAKMSAADFRQDWGLLVQNCSVSQRTAMVGLLEKVRAGGQDEINLLREIFGSVESRAKVSVNPMLDTFATELRRDPDRTLAAAMTAVMDRLWKEHLGEGLRAKLTPKGTDGKAVDAARVAAVVGSAEISRKELADAVDVRLQAFLAKPGATQASLKAQQVEMEQAALKELIDVELLHAAFKAMGNSIKPEQMDAVVSQFVTTSFGGSQARFEQGLKDLGVTLEQYRAKREKIIVAQAMRKQIGGMAPPPTEQEISQQVALAQAGAPPERQVRLRTLTIMKYSKQQNEAQQRKLINDLREKAKAGQEFGALAKEFSADSRAADEGKMDWLPASALSPVIAQPLVGMKVGEISAVVDIGTAWIIVKFDEERMQSKSAAELRKEASAVLVKQKAEAFFDTWLNNVRGKIAVVIVPEPVGK